MRREAVAMKEIGSHENICSCLNFVFVLEDGRCSSDASVGSCSLFVMVLEFLDGKTMRQVLEASPTGRLDETFTVRVGLGVLNGLKRVHQMGLTHKGETMPGSDKRVQHYECQ